MNAEHPETADDQPEWGWFKVYQSGMEVAGGTGPYEAIKTEAAHYAAMYRQDGSVRVRCQRIARRKRSVTNGK